MGFYADGAIQPYIAKVILRSDGEVLSRERAARLQQVDNEPQRALGKLIEQLIDVVYPEGRNTQLFVLTSHTDAQTVALPQPIQNTSRDSNGRRVAWVMGKRYTSTEALRTGPRTTGELEAAGG